MTSEIDYAKGYGQARTAYIQGNYPEAAHLIAQMAEAFPTDADVLLLQGHIYVSLQQFDLACRQYESVLQITDRRDLLDCARQALEQAKQCQDQVEDDDFSFGATESFGVSGTSTQDIDNSAGQTSDFADWQSDVSEAEWESEFQMDGLDWDSAVFAEDDSGEPTLGHSKSLANPFEEDPRTTFSGTLNNGAALANANPFDDDDDDLSPINWQALSEEETPDFSFGPDEDTADNPHDFSDFDEIGEATFVVSSDLGSNSSNSNGGFPSQRSPSSSGGNNAGMKMSIPSWKDQTFHDEPTIQATPQLSSSSMSGDDSFLDNLDAFNDEDLDGISKFDLTQAGQDLPDSDLFTRSGNDLSGNIGLEAKPNFTSNKSPNQINWIKPEDKIGGDLSEASGHFVKPIVEVAQGKFAWLTNAPLRRKQLLAAAITGATTFLVLLLVGGITSLRQHQPVKTANTAKTAPKSQSSGTSSPKPSPGKSTKSNPQQQGSPILLLALLGGLASCGSSLVLGQLTLGQARRSVEDLQNQCDAIYVGNFNVKATVYSEDELGQLATRFNQMSHTIFTTTSEAQQRAAETEQAKEELQRQVIRLLDEVEGAARGDLTVEAEVTADVLGAVADAFNLTIHNLREIVRQVKTTAKQVNKGSTDSESFARKNSTDSLQMAKELAVTLNSVQMMTESIQRVSENAREAEEVAHSSSVTALKGGDAVERTVAGILQIRETVSETARKVKRLAEASQEISRIVTLISQIASRTNLLALNASIQAARAGEAGRGFAIVADEVRQLADRSAKSLKEIEQIVLQIQSETGSVMTAMEEGIQQVIDVTDKSEQAKRSLEDIISVSNRINSLVRSITGDTVKQRENSRAVADVMQSVEKKAQETSQESQRVAGSLQNLVSISGDLLGSVEKFRVDSRDK